MTGAIQELRDYLGVDSDQDNIIKALHRSAVKIICDATGVDPSEYKSNHAFREAVRTQVWISYYAVRDGAKNTDFVRDHLVNLITALQYGDEVDGV